MLLINFIVIKRTKINIITEKNRNKTVTTAEKNNYNIIIEKNNKNNNKTEIAVYAIHINSKLINLIELSILISLQDFSIYRDL